MNSSTHIPLQHFEDHLIDGYFPMKAPLITISLVLRLFKLQDLKLWAQLILSPFL